MIVNIKKLTGTWDLGYALDKHTLSSIYLGDDERGHPRFNTTRSEPGKALYQLKYNHDWSQVDPIAKQIQVSLIPLLTKPSLIVPMPASNVRARQPVDEIAVALGKLINIPVFNNIVVKSPAPLGSQQLKDMATRAQKDAALNGRFSINPAITNQGCWNAILLDDLFDTGATMDAVCKVLRTYPKIGKIYAVAVTWK